ncbi:hypothetical protein MUK72_19335 (plasmid) [Halococcus dombrowskii]|uniref:DUF8160 domain-containing protein n=1 Tax=Halococcus dombrowskii TaxID=179637 RepID=A0AAV3SII1_HALDO|nr:hypothetical protein [Halococcus dombrowskii]UOO97305.1 hypothetical protein MUK72_19335 [Halococcus dombrowskii]
MSQDDSDDPQSRADRLIDRRGRTRSGSPGDNTNSEEETTQTGQSGQSEQTDTTGQTGQDGQDGQSEQTDTTGQTGQDGQDGQSEQPSNSDQDEDAEWSQAGDENVKRENKALYMYLDQRLHDTVTDVFEDVKYHYRKAYDVELQKNRHVYPLILEHGIEPVREMSESPAEVRDALDANPYTPVPAEVTADG